MSKIKVASFILEHSAYIAEKYFQCLRIPSLIMRVCLQTFSRCCLSKS